jgi:hypothetical protein
MRRSGGAVVLAALMGAGVIQERTTTVPAQSQQSQPSRGAPQKPPAQQKPTRDPVNTVGLPLDMAEELLRQDGYRVAAKNTDTTFGIIDPSNYTVCTQGQARGGTIVPVLAQKYGC